MVMHTLRGRKGGPLEASRESCRTSHAPLAAVPWCCCGSLRLRVSTHIGYLYLNTKLVKQAEREMWMNGSTDRQNHNWLNQKSISTVESFV